MMDVVKNSVSIFTVVALLTTSCAQIEKSKKSQYSVQGCVAGGLGAGIIAYVKNRGDDDSKEKVAIASMLGCMAGAVAGYHIGQRTEEYADAQSAARTEIKRNEKHLSEIKQYNAQLAQNIEDYRKEINMIKDSKLQQHEKKENLSKTMEIASKQRVKARESLNTLNEEIVLAKKQYNTYKASVESVDKGNWEVRLVGLEEEKEILASHVNSLNNLDASI
jgi:septal ring factor EnvC (AmiA/AmiB activator)